MLALVLDSGCCVVWLRAIRLTSADKASLQRERQEGREGSPYSTRHAVQGWVLPCPGKAKVTDLDKGRLLTIKQCVVQLQQDCMFKSAANNRCHDVAAQSPS